MAAITRQQQLAFIKSVIAAAQSSQAKWGVPASITIAQCIQESDWGRSELAIKARNYFGVKAVQGADYRIFGTNEVLKNGRSVRELAHFAFYASPAASFDAHGKLIATMVRYQPAMAVVDDPAAFALQIQACGYATDPNYPSELMRLVKQFNLTQYDTPPVPPVSGRAKELAA